MNKLHIALGALVLVAAPALSGCETNTEVTPSGETVTTPGIDDNVEAGVSALGDSIASGAEQTGDAIEAGAQNAADAVDSNVDLGDNAENQ